MHFPNISIRDKFIKWESYAGNNKICERFPPKEWHKMVADIHSDRDWKQFLSDYSHFVKCYMLYRCNDNTPIAFAYIMQEDEKGKVVSFHGGGWDKSISLTLLYYRGMIRLVEALLDCGLKVRTTCLKENSTALRFLKSGGFVNYRTSDKYLNFWINKNRLKSSKIYKLITNIDEQNRKF